MRTAHAPSAMRAIVRWRATTSAFSAAIYLLQDKGAAEQDEGGHGQRRDQERNRRAARVLRPLEEVDDQVADHHPVDPADQLRRQVLTEDWDEDEDDRGDDARPDLGNHHAPDRRERRRPQIHGGFELVPVETLERREEGQSRKRKVEMYEYEGDGPPVVEEKGQRLVDQTQSLQALVEHSTGAEDRDPRGHAKQVAGPERDDDQQEERPLPFARD